MSATARQARRNRPLSAGGSGAAQVTASEAIRERIAIRQADRAGRTLGFLPWARLVPEPKTGPLDFDMFAPQRELYAEGAEDKEWVIQKCTQIGLSAWAIRWCMYHCDTKGRTGLYIFPTARDMSDFSALRIGPTIGASKHLRARQRPEDPNNKGMRGIGLGTIILRGSEAITGLDSVDCDHIVFDEFDTLTQENIPDAEMRVSSPKSPGLIRRVGVPSDPDWGINKAYKGTDMRVWMVKCHACGTWQELDFWRNVNLETAQRECSSCRRVIDGDVAGGQWVATHKERRNRGYKLSRLIFPTVDIQEVIDQSRKRSPREQKVFYTKHLGEPFEEPGGRLSREAIQGAQRDYNSHNDMGYAGANLVTMGVDVASARDLNVRISEHVSEHEKRALYLGTADSFDALTVLMDRFKVNMCVVDHLPDGRLAMAFAERFAGRVYLVSYDATPNPRDPEVVKVNEEMRHVRARRTEVLDATFEMIRSQRNHLPQNLPEGYVDHLQANSRYSEEDETGKKIVGYRKRGADDYAHAEAYDVIATEVWYMRQGLDAMMREDIRPLDELLEFQRSGLGDYEPPDYIPGLDEYDSGEDFNFGPGG